jgi:hypothetical protein
MNISRGVVFLRAHVEKRPCRTVEAVGMKTITKIG